ncbi:NCOA7 [Blepharisma stoltei]|uniref:Uncharacterized protein n=1 Tax=Blepharisma stoltei TaxID=1481888 RepID=A0AAU9ITR2_9CILI|nr:unnamed protein product [Blepharisma stoltei]
MGFDDYTVQPGDTFISIAMRFDMSVYYLLRINRLSEVSEIFPDMILKVKHKEFSSESKQNSSDNIKIRNLTPTTIKEPNLGTGNQKKIPQHDYDNIFTTDVLYCTFEGEIKGQLCIFNNRLAFNPILVDNLHCEIVQNKTKKLILAAHAQTFICFWDIFNAIQYELPPIEEDQPPMHFIQFFLSKIGKDTNVANKKNAPKWCVNFQLLPIKKNYAELKGKALRIISYVTAYAHNPNKSIEENYQTFVPYYEINEDSEENLELKVNEPNKESKGSNENKDIAEQNTKRAESPNKIAPSEEQKTQTKTENDIEVENDPKTNKDKISEKNINNSIQQIEEESKVWNRVKICKPKQRSKIEEESEKSEQGTKNSALIPISKEEGNNCNSDKATKNNVNQPIKAIYSDIKKSFTESELNQLASSSYKSETSLTEEEPIKSQMSIDSFKDEIPNSDHDEIVMPWSTPHKNSLDVLLTSFNSEKIRIKHTPRKSSLDSGPKKIKSEASFEDIPIEDEPEEPLLIPLPDLSEPSTILSENMIKQIVINLPMMYQIRSWKLAYSPKLHGTSLAAFYRNLSKVGSSIIVVLTQHMQIFGGLASDTWAPSHQFYGNGDCFLFTFHNTKKIKCFFPTLENEYFMASSFEGISMGSGGKSGFYIYGDLMKGSSGVSKTYNNEVLSKFEFFNILKLEVWALV